MRSGAQLGGVMILTNIFYLAGLKSSLFSALFLFLFTATPFIAGRFAVIYRKRERGNRIGFTEAWLFLMIMFVCAATLTAVAQLIYFLFIDGGYFMEFLQEQFHTIATMEGVDAALKEQITTAAELLKKLTPRDLVMQFFGTNLMISPIITVLIAIFVCKFSQNKN